MDAWRFLDSDTPASNFKVDDDVAAADPEHKKKKVSKAETGATFVTRLRLQFRQCRWSSYTRMGSRPLPSSLEKPLVPQPSHRQSPGTVGYGPCVEPPAVCLRW